jgi:N-acetylglucosamine-6-sulfatase
VEEKSMLSRSVIAAIAAAILATGGFAGALIVGGGGAAGAQGAQPPPKPNVVVVMTDDQTVEQMKALGRVRSLIGAAGTTFARNFASYPLCCPSRSTFLTGQYAHNHGVLGNKESENGGYVKLERIERDTLPVWLKAAGYTTAHLGKYPNGYGRTASGPTHVPPGWDRWFGSVDPTTYHFFRYCINDNGRLKAFGGAQGQPVRNCPGAQPRPRRYQADVYSDQAVRFIRNQGPKPSPFFLSVAYLAPHGGGPRTKRCGGSAKPAPRHRGRFKDAPLPKPPSFNERDVSDKPAYIQRLRRFGKKKVRKITTAYRCRRESLLAVDEGVGRIVEALRGVGELDNTLVIFTADNGFFQGEHRLPNGKIKVYEPSVRVPALMRGPGVPAGRRVRSLTANIDLTATIVQAANARPGHALDGVSLRDVAQRPEAFAGRGILLENGAGIGPQNPGYVAVRTSQWKLIVYAGGERELYNIRSDPHERNNVADRVRLDGTLDRMLERLRTCKGESCRG